MATFCHMMVSHGILSLSALVLFGYGGKGTATNVRNFILRTYPRSEGFGRFKYRYKTEYVNTEYTLKECFFYVHSH